MNGLGQNARQLLGLKRISHTSFRFFFVGITCSEAHKDSYDYTRLLQLCKRTNCIKKIHAQIVIGGYEQNPFLGTKLVGKYTETSDSDLGVARKVFDNLLDRDVFLWNVIIKCYANLGPFVEALNMYDDMRSRGVRANRYTYPFVLKACGAGKAYKKGQVIHGQAVKSGFDLDLFVGNGLVAFYAKCQEVKMSRKVFDEIPDKDVVSWNSIISGYATNGYVYEALLLFHAMLKDGVIGAPDSATLVGILPACAQAAVIHAGFWIHSYIIKSGMQLDAALGSGLISLYSNCGYIRIARAVFDQISDKNIVLWNAIISCYGMHGRAEEALELFSQLVECGLCPDGIIFLCLLSACSHAGMLEKGWQMFESMEAYGVEKMEEHYACMVDLLGRAGYLNKAVEMIESMPMKAGKNVYGALLGACRIHNNIKLAELAADKLFVLDPANAGRYVILAKMYEDSGRWDDASRLRKLLREKEIRKPTGYSSIEVDSIRHVFAVKDESHPFTEPIFETLEGLDRIMNEDN